MATKMDVELKFQLEIAKKLYGDEVVNSLELSVSDFPTGYFGALMVGCGECFRRITKMVIAEPNLDNPYDIYTHCNIKLDGTGYTMAAKSDIINVGTEKRKKNVIKLVASDGKINTYVQAKYLDSFEDNAIYFIKDEWSPILVFLPLPLRVVGLVMPFVMKK